MSGVRASGELYPDIKPETNDLVVALNYYAPYVSGLTDTAKVVAEGLAARGWRVAVVAARHDRELPPRERLAGVDVIRTPVVARIGKGTISPTLPFVAARAARAAAVLNLHIPMLEAGVVARLARRTPLVATYHCDVWLPPGPANRVQVAAVDASSRGALRRAKMVVPSSDDYARHSRLWSSIEGHTRVISPPSTDRRGGQPTYRDGPGLHIGFLGRIVEEKGLEYLVEGFLAAAEPEDRLLIAGDYTKIAGGSVIDQVRARTGGDIRVRFLGFLPDAALEDFYASLDGFALPSVNSLEAFGIVQVEAMIAGVPSIATDIPGVRTPVQKTEFGFVVPPHNPSAIATAIGALRRQPFDRAAGGRRTRELYGAANTINEYEELFRELGSAPKG
ncbi:MAG: glycosyl transferase group 1 [Pseudonocardiales bacterium]|nr:glycosyl transferase group 1 [Pseudonocardiales bacterium]